MVRSTSVGARERPHLAREASTMALYVSVCLLAVLAAHPEDAVDTLEGLQLVWGTTLGLAFAHWFAFRLAGRMMAEGRVTSDDAAIASAQLGAAAGVACLVSIPVVVLPASAELDAARLIVASLIAAAGYLTGASAGVPRWRAATYGAGCLALAVLVAVTKNAIAIH